MAYEILRGYCFDQTRDTTDPSHHKKLFVENSAIKVGRYPFKERYTFNSFNHLFLLCVIEAALPPAASGLQDVSQPKMC